METVDDVHLAIRFASLLQVYIQDLRRSPSSLTVDGNSQNLSGRTTTAASTNPTTNYFVNNANSSAGLNMVGGVANHVNDSGASKDLGSAFVDDSLGYLSGLDAPMQLGHFDGSAGLAFNNPFAFNMDETWNIFGNMLE